MQSQARGDIKRSQIFTFSLAVLGHVLFLSLFAPAASAKEEAMLQSHAIINLQGIEPANQTIEQDGNIHELNFRIQTETDALRDLVSSPKTKNS